MSTIEYEDYQKIHRLQTYIANSNRTEFKDESLKGVNISFEGNIIRAVATDRYIELSRTVGTHERNPYGDESFIVKVPKIGKCDFVRIQRTDVQKDEIQFTGYRLVSAGEEIVEQIKVPIIKSQYPDVDRLWTNKEPNYEILINPRLMKRLMTAIGDDGAIRVQFFGPKEPVQIANQSLKGMLSPMQTTKGSKK